MKKYIPLFITLLISFVASAQESSTTYFLPGSVSRYELNPAFMPDRSILSLPAIGGCRATVSSDIAVNKLFYPKNGELVSFLDKSVDADAFMRCINDLNDISSDVSIKMLGLGFRSEKSYISFDVNVKNFLQATFPKDFFGFLKVTDPMSIYDLKNSNIAMTSYAETALGYSRKINDRLTVGAKVKYLAGVGNVDINLDKADVSADMFDWSATTKGTMHAALSGITIGTIYEDGINYYDFGGIDFNLDGLAGSGFAFDFGAEYNLLDMVKISAAVLDLGSIKWNKDSAYIGVANQTFKYSGIEYSEGGSVNGIDLDFDDIYKFQPVASEGYTTKLATTFLLGAETSLLGKNMTAGVLFSHQIGALKNISKLMLSANFNPSYWFSAALSYTLSKNTYDSVGVAMEFHPSWINLYLGTDYVVTRFTPQLLPVSANTVVAYMGIGIPLGRKYSD